VPPTEYPMTTKVRATSSIRPARKTDVPRICSIAREVCRYVLSHRRGRMSAPQEFSSPRRRYEEALKKRDRCLLVAANDRGRVLGYSLACIEHEPDDLTDVPRVEIVELAVDARSRGRSIGASLLEATHDWARSQGIALVQLAVWEFDEPALRLYGRAGYRTLMRKMELALPAGRSGPGKTSR